MPSSLATIRARLQIVLDDAGATVWTTAELDEHIQRGLRDLSHHIPLEKKSTIATVSGDRDLDISSLTDRIRVVAIELPTGNHPRTFREFGIWIDTLRFSDDPVPDGANCDIYWHGPHTINGTDTLPVDHDETLVFAAAWMACTQQAADTINAVTTGGGLTNTDWKGLASDFRVRYLERLNPRRGVQVSSMREPATPLPTQDSDPGP